MDSSCRTIFDLMSDGFVFYWWPIAGLGAGLLGIFSFVLYRAIAPRAVQVWQTPVLGLFGFLVATFVFTMYLPGRAFLEYRQIRLSEKNGDANIVRGIVSDYREFAPSKGVREESFKVCGVRFSYDPNLIAPGYRLTRRGGSPLQNGLGVEISYIGNTITNISLCEVNGKFQECQ